MSLAHSTGGFCGLLGASCLFSIFFVFPICTPYHPEDVKNDENPEVALVDQKDNPDHTVQNINASGNQIGIEFENINQEESGVPINEVDLGLTNSNNPSENALKDDNDLKVEQSNKLDMIKEEHPDEVEHNVSI